METTSKTPEVRGPSFVHKINNAIHGISNDSDQEERKLAQNILTTQGFCFHDFFDAKW